MWKNVCRNFAIGKESNVVERETVILANSMMNLRDYLRVVDSVVVPLDCVEIVAILI